MMSPEDRILLACTRQDFSRCHQRVVFEQSRRSKIRWDVVYQTAYSHNVAPLIYANLRRCSPEILEIPTEIWNRFQSAQLRNVALKSGVARRLEEVLDFFNRTSIDVMLIKGAALDILVYDEAWYVVHDVDLIIRPEREALSAADQADIHHLFHAMPGFEYDFFEHHDVVMNGVLPFDFGRVWEDALLIDWRGHELFVMCPEDMLLAACVNSCRKRFFRLKALLDIVEIIHKYPDLEWVEFIAKAIRCDCQNIAYVALRVARMTLGCPLPDEVLANLQINPIRARFIDWFADRMSLRAGSSLRTGRQTLGRRIDWSLILPYLTFHPYQIGRRLGHVWRTRTEGQ